MDSEQSYIFPFKTDEMIENEKWILLGKCGTKVSLDGQNVRLYDCQKIYDAEPYWRAIYDMKYHEKADLVSLLTSETPVKKGYIKENHLIKSIKMAKAICYHMTSKQRAVIYKMLNNYFKDDVKQHVNKEQ